MSHAGPLSEHTGPLSSESWRGPGGHSQQSPPFLARTAEGLSWLGGPDVGATTIGSSQSRATTIGAGGGSLSYLGSGGSGGSPVDVRSAGRGALGLTSPPSGRFHHEGDEEKGEREREAYSPPQPRAFWREEWHGGRSGGSGSRGIRSQGNRSHGDGGGDDGGSSSRSRRSEEAADLFGVDCETRDWNEDRQMAESERFATATPAPPRRLNRESAEEGVGTARCRTRNASRDLLMGQDRRENGASGGSSEWAKSGKGRGKNVDFSSGLGDGFYTNRFDKAAGNGNGGSGGSSGSDGRSGGSSGVNGSGSSGSGVLSAAGFALLASVAVTAFAVGALLAPPPPRQRSAFPSAAPLEYARQRPSPGYEPTMVERREKRGKNQRIKLGTMQTAAASAPQAWTAAADERSGESDARDVATAAAPGGAQAVASPSHSRAGSSTTGCPKPATTDVDGRQPDTTRFSPFFPARDVATVTAAATAGASVGASPPGADADNSRRGKTYPGAIEPTAGVANLAWNRDFGDLKWRRWRQRVRPPATQRLVVGVDPDAFAKTLGSAENSLVFLSDGDDRQARRDAWRAAASERAATTACKAMASSSVTSATEGGGWEDGPCDTGTAASKNRGGRRGGAGGGRVTPDMFPFFPAQGGTPTLSSEYTNAAAVAASQPVPALSVAAASTMAPSTVAPNHVRHTEDTSRAPSVQQTEHGAQTPLASKSGGGEQLGSTSKPAAQHETSDYRRPPHAVNDRERGPALPPSCSGLVLSGNDVQASWAGLYTLTLLREARVAPGTDPPATPLIETPVYFRERALLPPFGKDEECEGGEGQGTSDPSDSVTLGGTDSVSYGRIDAAVPDRTDFVSADWTDAVAPGRTGSVILDRIDSVTPDRTDSVSAGRTDSVSAWGEASGGVFSSLETPLVRTPDDAAPLTPPTSGDQQQQLGGPGAAADGIVLCLYWADASGGRWVLDDDLSLSNGVLGVTKEAVPASPYLAFPNHRHHRNRNPQQQHHYHHTHNQLEQHSHNHRGSGDGGSGGGDGVSQKPLPDGAGDGEGRGGAALSPPLSLPSSFSPSPWLLDSPRLQGWAEAEDVVVVCETN